VFVCGGGVCVLVCVCVCVCVGWCVCVWCVCVCVCVVCVCVWCVCVVVCVCVFVLNNDGVTMDGEHKRVGRKAVPIRLFRITSNSLVLRCI